MRVPRPPLAMLGLAVGVLVGVAPLALGDPNDPFSVALPGKDTTAPQGVTAKTTADVEPQQGAATYTYPIDVPPGRGGVAPALSLSYSSDGALRGGLAVGWSLSGLPAIERNELDDSKVISPGHATPLYRYDGALIVPATGDNGTGTRYRPMFDAGFTRIESSNGGWTASTPDGTVRVFSGAAGTGDGVTRWNITSQRDPFGNTITYKWSPVVTSDGYVDFVPQWIEYSSNPTAGLAAHARVELAWQPIETCGSPTPIGARLDDHFDEQRMFGAQRLTSIKTLVRDVPGGAWRTSRVYTLGYDASELACNADHPALRYLTTLGVTAYDASGTATIAPTTTFSYAKARDLGTTTILTAQALGERGTDRGPEAQLLDWDGDGILDQVRVGMPTVQGGRCQLYWRKGSFGGVFSPVEGHSELPSAAWSAEDSPLGSGGMDACTLNGQIAWRPGFGSTIGKPCSMGSVQISYRFLDWDHDGDPDLVATVDTATLIPAGGDFGGYYEVDTGSQGSCPNGTELMGAGTIAGQTTTYVCECPASAPVWDSGTQSCITGCGSGQMRNAYGLCVASCQSYDQCKASTLTDPPTPSPPARCDYAQAQPSGELYVFTNEGGTLLLPTPGTNPTTITLPNAFPKLEIPPNGGPMAPPEAGVAAIPTLVDIDGDGYQDLVRPAPNNSDVGNSTSLSVWRGGPAGFASTPVSWSKPTWVNAGNTLTYSATTPNVGTQTEAFALTDLNGDGLPDFVIQASGGELLGSYNGNGSFGPFHDLGIAGPVARNRIQQPTGWKNGQPLSAGYRGIESDLVDVDDDDVPELTAFTTGASLGDYASQRRIFHFNGNPATSSTRTTVWEPLERLVVSINGRAWYRASDFTDLTGDGLPDLVAFDRYGTATVTTDAPGAAPPHVLVSVDNGHGGVTRFTYGSSVDPSLVTSIAGMRNDPRWVVTSQTVTPGSGQPDLRTTYHYAVPQYGFDSVVDPSQKHFLGFTTVTIDRSGQAGDGSARTVDEFNYTLGGGGHLVSELVSAKTATAYAPVRHESSIWLNKALVGGIAVFPVRSSHVTRTCAAGATADQCKTDSLHALTVSDTWTSWSGTGGTILYTNTQTKTSEPGPNGTTMRQVIRTFQVRAGQAPYPTTDYRILETKDETYTGGLLPLLLARTATTYDDTTGLPIETDTYANGASFSATKRGFDAQTGNLLWKQKPTQLTTGSKTSFAYDAHRLFVARTTDELGHVVNETHEMGTGALVRREGPNFRYVPGTSCPFLTKCVVPAYAPEEWSVDGFGRVTQHRVAIDPPLGQSGYALGAVEWTTFADGATPATRTSETLRDFGGTVKLTSVDAYDGLGRVTKHTQRLFSGTCDAVTTYQYDAAGALLAINAPDPRQDACKTVSTVFLRDGIGRVTQLARPDGSSEVMSYDGLSSTGQTISPADGGDGAITLDHDPMGRLVAVHEPDAEGDHVTRYTFDELDRMTTVTDADGTYTSMGYDLRGLRTGISRAGRVWTYAYDADGNMVTEQSPVPSGGDPAQYTSISTYDALDRQTTHTPASRGMSGPRLAALGVGMTTTTYDGGANGIGQPSHATLPFGSIDYTYDVHELPVHEARTINVAYRATLSATQSVDRTYNAVGAPVDVTWNGTGGTKWTYAYDPRGLVSSVTLTDAVLGTKTLATYTRSIAGQPRARTTPSFDQRRDWTYDALGRVFYDRISRASTDTTWAERTYGYDGLGRLRTVDGQVDGQNADALYDYDRHDRITSAQGPGPYTAALTYSAAGNITRATVAGASDVPNRDVTYQYGTIDPQAVDTLVDATNGALVASMAYDGAGNLTSRTGASPLTITSDGDDQIREVTGAGGTETYYFGPDAERIVAIGPGEVKVWFGEDETHFTTDGVQTLRWHAIAAGEPIARVEKAGASGSSSSLELQYADSLANLILTIDGATNGVTSSFLYGAFGEVVASSGGPAHRREFNGKEDDAATGLRAYGYRSYDPLLLRWTAADPLYRFRPDMAWAVPQRGNLYAFSLNNPIRYLDPDGRCDWTSLSCWEDDPGGAVVDAGTDAWEATPGGQAVDALSSAADVISNSSSVGDAVEGLGKLAVKPITDTVEGTVSDFGCVMGECNGTDTAKTVAKIVIIGALTHGAGPEDPGPGLKGARTEPIDLQEQLSLDEAKAGAGEPYTGKLGDPKYDPKTGTHDKMQHNHDHGDGTSTEVHYDVDRQTGERSGFKIKDDTNAASRGHRSKLHLKKKPHHRT